MFCLKKITFFGDIMCEPTVLKGAKKGKTYDFSYVFSGTRSLLKSTDYRIGNLETPLCTKEMGYCDDFADFGCPDFFRISTCVDHDMLVRSLPVFKALIEE